MAAKIITIDGPSGVGKGTIAAMLADTFAFHLLDSGALYRVTAVNALRLGLDLDDAAQMGKAASNLVIDFVKGRVFLQGEDISERIRTLVTGQAASRIAIHAVVREKLFEFMQGFVRAPGIVADGRDMGTVVFPEADVKLFLTASAEVRAKRRYKQLKGNDKSVTLNAVFSELAERDERDKNRENAPLEPAKDAVVIDTGQLGVSQVFEKVQTLVVLHGIMP
ncbi:MAG: (d)CMP kinase [Ostreibacterium sp.]